MNKTNLQYKISLKRGDLVTEVADYLVKKYDLPFLDAKRVAESSIEKMIKQGNSALKRGLIFVGKEIADEVTKKEFPENYGSASLREKGSKVPMPKTQKRDISDSLKKKARLNLDGFL